MRTDGPAALLAATLMLLAGAAAAADPVPVPPAGAQAAQQAVHNNGLRTRLLRDEPSVVRALDPAVFTDLLPVSASEPAVRLPADQREEAPAGSGQGP